ncbi:MAG: nucleotidyltransferase domain-containing protein [Spirochaetes bacterium]|nr:nucleotidyltransferase domain-containing protein [Spirochaetota bacterium]
MSTFVLRLEYIMLEILQITKSKIRRDLLSLFFTNPVKKYYVRELERILDYSAGNIRRELLRLQKDNLFLTQKTGNLLYYFLNKDHPLFTELKSIIAKTIGVEASIRNRLLLLDHIKVAFIYGSFAMGKEKSESDIDLMIIGDPDTTLLNENIAQLENKLKREINPTIYTFKEFKNKKSTSGFIKDLLKNPKIMLIGKEDDL